MYNRAVFLSCGNESLYSLELSCNNVSKQILYCGTCIDTFHIVKQRTVAILDWIQSLLLPLLVT